MADETKPFLSSIPQTPPSPSSKNLPNFKQPTVGLKYIKNRHTFLFLTSLILGILAAHNSSFSTEVLLNLLCSHLKSNFISVIICTILITFLSTFHLIARSREVYLIEFSCYKPSDSEKCSRPFFMHKSISAGVFTSETLAFQKKILERSGLGDSTYLPQVLHDDPTNTSIEDARNEAKEVMFGAIDKLLERTKLNPNDIGILVVNCSVFNPNPSLSSMIVNHYKLRKNIASYNLGGMGCSAGLISIDLAQRLLQLGQPNRSSYALVVSTENMSLNWYTGNDKSMLVSNCIFRMGAAAILLSNKKRSNAKYKLLRNVIRTHMGSDNSSFSCITQREDSTGKTIGISLSKDLINVAGDALKTNITTLAPLVLPFSEQLLFMLSWVAKKVFKIKLYVPDFKLALEHFCIHAGGRAVLDEIEKNMQLSEWHMEPSRMTLYRFGNTSSSSLWYELAYSEAKGRVRKGDKVWQIAFGSGFKCNSAVWKALRSVNPAEEKHNPWNDEIHHFPVDIPKVSTF